MNELPRPPERPPRVTVSQRDATREWLPSTPSSPRSGGRGCGTAAVLGVLAVAGIVGIALAAVAFRSDRDVERSVSELEVGDCLLQTDGSSEYLFEVVDCADPHDDEVFAVGRLDEAGDLPYPGVSDLRPMIERICVGEAFTAYVGVPAHESGLHVLFTTPDARAWTEARGAYACLVDGGGEPLEGSVRGRGRRAPLLLPFGPRTGV